MQMLMNQHASGGAAFACSADAQTTSATPWFWCRSYVCEETSVRQNICARNVLLCLLGFQRKQKQCLNDSSRLQGPLLVCPR